MKDDLIKGLVFCAIFAFGVAVTRAFRTDPDQVFQAPEASTMTLSGQYPTDPQDETISEFPVEWATEARKLYDHGFANGYRAGLRKKSEFSLDNPDN